MSAMKTQSAMKTKLLLAATLLLLPLPALAQDFQQRWNSKVSEFRRQNARLDADTQHIVLFGSSSMEGWRYSKRIEKYLGPLQPRILNRGISGDGIGIKRTTGLYNRMDESVVGARPSHVFILNGRNSMGYGPARVAARYREVVRSLRRALPDTVVCVITCSPVRGSYAHMKDKIVDFNERLKTMAKEEGAWLIDLHPHLTDDRGLLKSDWTGDGLHFRNAGYEILGRAIQRVVRQSEEQARERAEAAAQAKAEAERRAQAEAARRAQAEAQRRALEQAKSAESSSECPSTQTPSTQPPSTQAQPRRKGLIRRLLDRLRRNKK